LNMKYLIVGLGNIGAEYELTRHNIGFLTLDRLADKKEVKFESNRLGSVTKIKHKGRNIHLLKPTTYMNLSGKAVRYWLDELKLGVDQLLIVTDDLALPYGSLRMRLKGSDGGHNGLKSVAELLSTTTYPRLRMGIGSDFSKGNQVDYVLSNFTETEMAELVPVMDRAIEMILSFSANGAQRTMNQFND